MTKRHIFMCILGLCVVPGIALAQTTLFSTDFNTSTGIQVFGTADTAATFGFDYSTVGVPQNPNSPDTLALKLEANITAGAANEIAAVTSGLSLSQPYQVTFDFWMNANGAFPAGGGGSTEFGGGVVGHDGVTAGRNGASLLITGEGGSSRDWRLYKDTGEQFYESGQYNPALASNNASDPVFVAAFPGQAAPAAQQALYAQQTGTVQDGTPAFGWHEAEITVFGDLATFKVDGLEIGAVNPNIGSSVSLDGEAGVIYADLFSSVSDNAALSFGLFDNFVVTDVPEPATFALLGLGGLGALLRRRR